MKDFSSLKIKSPYNIKYIEDVKFDWKPNEHASFYLKGIVEDSSQFNAVNSAGDGDEFTLYEGEEGKTIFKGQTSSVKVTNVNGIYYIELKGISGSFNLDQSKKSRSFQDENMEYGSLISQTIKDYSGSNFMQYVGEGEKIGKPIIQYKETAWEFLKRMASKFNSVIVCDIMENKPRFYFGLPERMDYTIDDDIPYTASKDIKAFEASGASEAGLSDIDFFYYEIESGEQYSIGNEINFKNKNLIVTEVQGYMDRGLFKYKYKLSRKAGLYCQEIKNKALSGAAIDGKILAVQGETVRMHLSIDSEQVTTKAHWFPFAPPTANMMYCMPKIGTSARLYFPDTDSGNAEVTGNVRDNGGSCAKTGNPNNRYLGTEHGSELAMLPGEMSLTESSKKNLYMSMKNDTGLDFTSHKKIILNAVEGVCFKTPKKVIINAGNSVLVTKARQKKGFSLEGDFNVLGANSKIEAKYRTTYPDFNDEPKNDTKAKAAAIAKKKAEAEKKSGFSWGKLALFAVAAVAVVAVAVVAPVAAAVVGAALIGAALGANALASSGKLEGLEQKLKNEVKDIKGLLCGALMGPYKFMGGLFNGFINSAGEDIMGLINFIPNIVKDPIGFLKNMMFINSMVHPATANDYMMQEAVLGGIWNEIKTGFNDDFLHGDADSKGKYAGTAIWTAITLFNPEGKIGDLGKVDKVINGIDKSDDGEKLIKEVDNPIINNIRNKVPNEELTPPKSRGNAPISNKDGRPIEIHHSGQNPKGPFDEMHPSDHRYGENYKENHPNYNKPSKIDRKQFRKDKRGYWENEWDNGRWDE